MRPASLLRSALAFAALSTAAHAQIDKPLIAHWSFDEVIGWDCLDASGHGLNASPQGAPSLLRAPGVLGNAMVFSDSHMLSVPGKPNLDGLRAVSFSAWTLPTDLGTYREIFRKEDGDTRVLFSYQNDGTILSLGLNVGGYVECDAKIDPAQVLDGRWHHCAATFDGETMRVYLDGREIGSLPRVGAISAGGLAPGCIGSSNGGECFQGALDDLRIYAAALTADEVAALHQEGVQSLDKLAQSNAADEPQIDRPLLAQWTFNETGLGPLIRNSAGNADLDVDAKALLVRTRGVHGSALNLAGTHALRTNAGPGVDGLPAITFSAWTRPTDLRGYREIFREEAGDRRLLFSYQADGTILSLGLNIGGYVECDAPIDPAQVTDGAWHHCAGTFDGQTMRVYVDGREIGSLDRPGTIATDPAVPGFIGSSSGDGEHFQGSLDDLRIYRAALSPQDIAHLYDAGRQALDRFARQLDEQISAFYSPEPTFAQTLANARRQMVSKGIALDLDLAGVLLGKLRSSFGEDYGSFAAFTGASPLEYLTARADAFQVSHAERLMGLLLEYKPLTESQKAKQTPEEVRKWEEADAIARRFEELKARGETARFSPEWIDVMLETGHRIDLRPYQSEAVAPYVRPETPPTRGLTPAEARAALERDWLHQAGGNPSPERIRAEIGWARRLADRGASSVAERAKLDELQKQAEALSAPDRDLYFRVREVKRAIMFADPVIDFSKVLFVDMPFPQGSEWAHETRHRLGYMAVPGGRLLVLDGLSPEGKLTQLMPQAPLHGSFWRPDVSWDGQRVLFCFKPHNEKSFHVYEIGADGSGLRQITDGRYDDFDPIYLPDGQHIVFSTTRAHTYVRCMPPTNAYILARCDLQGRDIYLISGNNEPDYLPSVMSDGRLIYTRWEYTDKPLWRAQKLWTVNPDGTHVSLYWGNQSVWPDLLKDARSIPGSNRVMFTGSAHHNWFAGSVGIIDPSKGLNFPNGLTKVTADLEWPEVGNGPVDPVESPEYHPSGAYAAYYSPYPLSDRDFLVSANRGGKFVLYLMDIDGNRELIYEGVNNILHAIPLKPREKPPVVPDAVAWPDRAHGDQPQDGIIYSSNVYDGAPEQLQGKAKFLRVMAIDAKTYTYWYKRPYISTGPVVSIVQSEGVKRIVGTVPIEADGSVSFLAPPGKSLHFQLLDEQQRALQTMRSFVNVMPGERRGCLGCHELHSTAPAYESATLALSHRPRKITPPPWEDTSVSYERYVQPVLDRYCGKCHQGDGEARKTLDLTRRPGFLMFDEPYVTLTGHPSWGAPYQPPDKPPPGFGIAMPLMVEGYAQTDPAAYTTPEAMSRLSYKSPLIDIASSGKHYDVKVDEESRLRLITWVDAMCPYVGDEEVRREPDPQFQGVDWLAIRPRIATAPVIDRPGPLD
ncbi:MAG: hypothetical protein FJX75_22030 [Armatimonadetes bacterium]|nr:hypothetical protein [Armatimonadota bacterium]